MAKASQKDIVLQHLLAFGSISTLQCYELYKITDLQHAIMLLRKDKYQITDKWEKSNRRTGYSHRYKRYYLERIKNETIL